MKGTVFGDRASKILHKDLPGITAVSNNVISYHLCNLRPSSGWSLLLLIPARLVLFKHFYRPWLTCGFVDALSRRQLCLVCPRTDPFKEPSDEVEPQLFIREATCELLSPRVHPLK